ncbi:MAG: hypothetical protein IJM68_00790 [Synergistaceae bacterium]|nr:hypothetical protein [Synergistaceae bacterium]
MHIKGNDEPPDDIWATGEEIGAFLEYANPKRAIARIHKVNKERLDKFSRTVQLVTPEGGTNILTVYNFRGLLEICRKSRKPNANRVIDWVYSLVLDETLASELHIERKSEKHE